MLTIIHGEDIAASRNYYLSERNKQRDKVILESATLTLTDLTQALSGSGLFGDQQAIFIEELFSKRKPGKELDAIISSLQSSMSDNQSPVFLWESKDLTAKQLSTLKGASIKQFKIPQTVFAFLDALLPKNTSKLLTLFHQLLQTEDANFALFMLQRQIRILLALSSDNYSSSEQRESRSFSDDSSRQARTISEVSRLAPWQKGKLQKQAKAFTLDQLLNLHEKLYHLELGQKTGGLSMPLKQELDFFLASI